jgi:hypothetical protein
MTGVTTAYSGVRRYSLKTASGFDTPTSGKGTHV